MSLRARGSDEQLAKAVASGREDAFAELYRRHHQSLYRYCRSILHDGEEAQDALQSAMTNAFAALRRRERDLAVRPWLFRIAHNEAITLLRRRRTRDAHLQRVAMEAAGRQGAAPGEVLEQQERLQLLLADLAALAERQRATLLMRELNGLSIEEIAGALAITQGAAKQALFEARSALKDLAEGRTMECESVQSLIDGRDGRVLRSRVVRSHLRSCATCRELERSIATRSADLRALTPPLPAIAGGALLARVLAGAGGSHGAAVAAGGAAVGGATAGAGAGSVGLGSGAAAGGGASSVGLGSGAAGATGGIAGGGAGGGLAGVLGGSIAAKGVVGAVVVALAAGGAVHVLSGGDGGSRGRAVLGGQVHALEGTAKSTTGAHLEAAGQTQRRRHGATAPGANRAATSSDTRPRSHRGATLGGASEAAGAGHNHSRELSSAGAPGVSNGAAKHHANAPQRARGGSGHSHSGGRAGVKPAGSSRPSNRGAARRHASTRRSQTGGKSKSQHGSSRAGGDKSQAKSSPQTATETEGAHHGHGAAGHGAAGHGAAGHGAAASEGATTSTTASTGLARGH